MQYIKENWIIEKEKKMLDIDLVLSIGCWMDGLRYECELEVVCKRWAEFKQT